MCQGLGPRALKSYFWVEERGKGQECCPLEGGASALVPCPPGSPCSSPEVPSQAADLDLQDIEEVEVSRDTWLGE